MNKAFLLLAGTLLLGACKKDSENTPSKTDLLTSKSWRLTAQTVTFTVGGTTTSTSNIDACNQDDYYKFGTDKTLVEDAGIAKCGAEAQRTTGSWDFSNTDQTKLRITLPNSALNGDADIKELSSTTLHIYTNQTTNGITYTIDATLTSF